MLIPRTARASVRKAPEGGRTVANQVQRDVLPVAAQTVHARPTLEKRVTAVTRAQGLNGIAVAYRCKDAMRNMSRAVRYPNQEGTRRW